MKTIGSLISGLIRFPIANSMIAEDNDDTV